MIDSPAKPVPRVSPAALGSDEPLPRPVPLSPPDSDAAHHYRQVVPERITPNDYPRLTSLVHRLAPDAGAVRELGDGLLWEHDSGYSALALTINPEPAGTVIRADLRIDGRLSAYYLGATGASALVGVLAGALVNPWVGLAAGVTGLLPLGWIAKQIWRRSGQRSMQQVRAVVDHLAAAIRGELD